MTTGLSLASLIIAVIISLTHVCFAEDDGEDCIRIDAGLTYRGKTYLFHGDQYVKLDSSLTEVRKGPIHEFGGMRGSVDAAVTWSGNRRTYFFQGGRYYSYSMLVVGPYKTQAWDAMFADGIDAVANRKGDSYFFKDCSIVRMERKKREISETLVSGDLGLPCRVDAAFTMGEDMFIIKGNGIWRWGDDVSSRSRLDDVITLTSWNVCPAAED